MQSPPSKSLNAKYEALPTAESDGLGHKESPKTWGRIFRLVALGLTVVIALLLSFLAGRHSLPSTQGGLLLPPGATAEVWQHNLTFSSKPSPESEAAWSSIIPVGRGFVHHPEIAPFISNIAVFHQLHCLHGIRVAYYTTLHEFGSKSGSTTSDPYLEQLGARTDNIHMRHCFDYLRHALMCAADTNLEAVSQKTHVTTGWGSPRKCRNYAAVKEWAELWRNSSDTGIL